MELPQLGEHCDWPLCNTLDFLPMTCTFCKHSYCSLHFQPSGHECPLVVQAMPANYDSSLKNYVCTFDRCTTAELVQMLCVKCNRHFCLEHRYHKCFNYNEEEIIAAQKRMNIPKEAFQKSLNEINAKIDENLEKSKKSGKSRETALKVQLMRLKGKAVGLSSIPVASRLYFLVYQPLSTKGESKSVYISKDWTIGRAIDAIASACNVKNRNNEANASKLRLFKKIDGRPIATDMSCLLESLLKVNVVENGDSVILEYVDCTETFDTFELPNFIDYRS